MRPHPPAPRPFHETVSAHVRGAITRAVKETGEWHGTRRGIKLEFKRSSQPTLEGLTLEWRARVGKIWHQGKAGNVWDALQEIGKL